MPKQPSAPKKTPRKRGVRGSRSGRPIMALLDLLGRRWSLRILWELREQALTSRALRNAVSISRRGVFCVFLRKTCTTTIRQPVAVTGRLAGEQQCLCHKEARVLGLASVLDWLEDQPGHRWHRS